MILNMFLMFVGVVLLLANQNDYASLYIVFGAVIVVAILSFIFTFLIMKQNRSYSEVLKKRKKVLFDEEYM